MHPDDAARFGFKDHDTVAVRVGSDSRALTFDAVTVRVSPAFRLEMHVDADEANAAGLHAGDTGELYLPTGLFATVEGR
jgi:propanediol utilization protein